MLEPSGHLGRSRTWSTCDIGSERLSSCSSGCLGFSVPSKSALCSHDTMPAIGSDSLSDWTSCCHHTALTAVTIDLHGWAYAGSDIYGFPCSGRSSAYGLMASTGFGDAWSVGISSAGSLTVTDDHSRQRLSFDSGVVIATWPFWPTLSSAEWWYSSGYIASEPSWPKCSRVAGQQDLLWQSSSCTSEAIAYGMGSHGSMPPSSWSLRVFSVKSSWPCSSLWTVSSWPYLMTSVALWFPLTFAICPRCFKPSLERVSCLRLVSFFTLLP